VPPADPGRRLPRRRFLAYWLASLVPVVAIGLIVGLVARGQLQDQGLAQAKSEGAIIDQALLALVGPDQKVDLTAAQESALVDELRAMTSEHRFYGLRLHGSGMDVDVGGPFPRYRLSAAQLAAVRRGEEVADVQPVPGGGHQAVAVSELMIPGRPGGGYLTVILPYDLVQAELGHELAQILLGLGLGLAVLWVVLVLITRSVTRGLRQEASLNAQLARHDLLTALPNRLALAEHVARLLARPRRRREPFALVVADLDQFKHVNDSLGHRVGDQLLREAADRLRSSIRSRDFVARLGGDEFALVLAGPAGHDAVRAVIDRVRASLRADVEYEGVRLSLEGSFGVAVFPDDGDDGDLLLQHADAAMYRAKSTDTSVQFYDEALDASQADWLGVAGQLRTAVRAGDLRLRYQPTIDLGTGALVGAEALVRWQHPERGLVGPREFLAVAERSRTMGDLTAWVLDEALAQLARWDRIEAVPGIAVNVSTRNLHREDRLPDTLAALLRAHHVAAERVTLEVTETALVVDDEGARQVLQALHRMGVRISIDDFGQGYTGLGYLRHLPVCELKVDQDFVCNMVERTQDDAIVRSIADLARRLGLRCAAEGIESEALYHAAWAAGCQLGQGFFIAEPLDPDELVSWVRARRAGSQPGRDRRAGAPLLGGSARPPGP